MIRSRRAVLYLRRYKRQIWRSEGDENKSIVYSGGLACMDENECIVLHVEMSHGHKSKKKRK